MSETFPSTAGGAAGGAPPDPSDRPGLSRGWRPRTVVWLLLVLAVVGIGQRALRFTLPTDGWEATTDFESDNPIYVRPAMQGLELPDGLRSGDQFVDAAGVTFDAMAQAAGSGRALRPPGYEPGATIAYTVLREGNPVAVHVPIVGWTLAGIARATWHALFTDTPLEAATGWFALLLAMFLFWRRPDNLTVQLLLISTSLGTLSSISWIVSPGAVSDLLTPWSRWSASIWSHLIHVLAMAPVNLHLILTFPRPRAWLVKRRWLFALIYGIPWVAFAASFVGVSLVSFFVLVVLYSLVGFAGVTGALLAPLPAVERAQSRWFALGFALSNLGFFTFGLSVLNLLPDAVDTAIGWIPGDALFVTFLAVAVLRYRLFAIDVILERTLVYGTLTALVVGVYALVVSGVGGLLRPSGGLPLSLVATGLVAVAFQPVRERLQRGVTRMLYGRRDEPYQVLSDLGRVLGTPAFMAGAGGGGGSGLQALNVLTDTVARALKLPYVALALDDDGGSSRVVAETGALGLESESFALAYQGQPLGELRVAPRGPRETFSARERRLLDAIARQASVAAFAVRLNGELQRSRERLVNALEDERRRLRRDLHDGLGPTLAAVSMQLDAAQLLVGRDPENAQEVLGSLKAEVQDVLHEIRRLVYALRPPALDELGLVSALREHVHRSAGSALKVRFEAPEEVPSLPAAVEVAAYRIALEAVANVVRHAQARCLCVTLRVGRELELEIEDDGVGIAPDRRLGVGLSSMAERAEELGGSLTLTPLSPSGTRVTAQLPLQGQTGGDEGIDAE